ncbi:hypothetical protein CS369_21845 [Candidatus Symbiopectobacterium sp. 'North America']|uniref:hypothetical protein n=1 Tax=Candidatus Symbiopectobacterium sp. 'North America' TaxID=2794574 RepID=UPI0018C9C5B3|nr:hypothetical protein [Candidatus Symbiopectobacterium sp. 'North America']MBG6246697.1 hypothetical protein [Candidatus Symbiopectobacterium sp. 'North America']
MKLKTLSAILFCEVAFSSSTLAGFKPEGNESEAIAEAVKDGYQVQRNLAFNYRMGRGKPGDADYIPKDFVKACAWRKILLVSNPDKINDTDSMNERYECGEVKREQDVDVWRTVHKYLPLINNAKSKGEYMVVKEDDEPGELQIIDVP